MKTDIQTLRTEYRAIRMRSHANTTAEFEAAVAKLLEGKTYKTEGRKARAYVAAAKAARFRCRRCAGTGAFITYVENGEPKGPGGICYRCNGVGTQDDADARRNYGADMHQVVRVA